MNITPKSTPTVAAAEDKNERLKKAAKQLEGVFVEQLFKAMRETVPDGGLVSGGQGEEIFTSMMDQHLASQVPSSLESGLSAALYRQMGGGKNGPASTPGNAP